MSQLVRYCDINSNMDTYEDVKLTVDKLVILRTILKVLMEYLYKWSKFGVDIYYQQMLQNF